MADSFRSRDDRSSWERDLAQKHVTIMSSCSAEVQVEKTDERIWDPVPRAKWTGFDVVMRVEGLLAQ